MNQYDIIIIGAGPGGLTAGIYAGRQGTKNLIIDKDLAGGLGREVPEMENYPGFDNISGMELIDKMKSQAIKNCELHENEDVLEIIKNDDEYRFTVKTDKDSYLSKTVILATGSSHRELNAKGEEEFKGKGYGEFKLAVGEVVADRLAPIQEEFRKIADDKAYLEKCMKEGAEKAYKASRRTLQKVYKKVGFIVL